MDEAEVRIDADAFTLHVSRGEYDVALGIVEKYVSPCKKVMGGPVAAIIDLYVGLRRTGRDDDAYAFAAVVSGVFNNTMFGREILDEQFYKSLLRD